MTRRYFPRQRLGESDLDFGWRVAAVEQNRRLAAVAVAHRLDDFALVHIDRAARLAVGGAPGAPAETWPPSLFWKDTE